MAAIRTAAQTDLDRIRAFYRAAGYTGPLGADDQVLLAEIGEELVGVVRLALECGVIVLRGMRVAPSHQRQGIGNQLLDAVDQVLGRQRCYCIPYEHLAPFYGRIGFQDLDPAAAPGFLADRLREYQLRRPERFRLMSRHWV